MKIHYVANSRIPTEKAHGIQIMKMCEAFADLENDVDLILPKRKYDTNTDVFDYYQVKHNFNIIKLRTYDPYWLIRGPQGWYTKLQGVIFLWHLNSYFSQVRLTDDDLIYVRHEYLLPLLQKFSDRVVWEAHDLPKRKKHYVKYWNKCKKIVAITAGLKDDLVKLGVEAEKIIVVPDGVDLEQFDIDISTERARKKLNLPLDQKIVMYTGHLYPWKGAHTLLDAVRSLQPTDSSLLFVFVGGTDDDIKKFKKKSEGAKNVMIVGQKPHSEIPFYLKAADVLVLPTSGKTDIGRKYTSPIKLFEYMASGKPIITSDIPALREILDFSSAVFFESDNPNSLAQAIEKAAFDSELLRKLSSGAKSKIYNFTWSKRARNILGDI